MSSNEVKRSALSTVLRQVGLKLVQAANALYPDTEMEQIEDALITGVLRERVGVELVTLEDTWLAAAWLQLLSHCPWLTITKLTFSNTLVREKRSSRAHVQYVGGLLEPRVWRYYTCLHAEVGLLALENLVPGLVPDFIWDICTR